MDTYTSIKESVFIKFARIEKFIRILYFRFISKIEEGSSKNLCFRKRISLKKIYEVTKNL